MIVAIHQPHYFPWVGYFDKMAKADTFVLLDQVQFEKGSQMIRNRVLDNNGAVKYITISAETKAFLDREYNCLEVKDVKSWTDRQLNALKNYYQKSPYVEEILQIMKEFLSNEYSTVCGWTCASIDLICKLMEIETPIILQSEINYDRSRRKSDLVLAICDSLKSDRYFSGRGGSVEYLDRDEFGKNGVDIVFQDFKHPEYTQCNTKEFVPGLSILDMLFNCGVNKTRELFWDNVRSTNEFGE